MNTSSHSPIKTFAELKNLAHKNSELRIPLEVLLCELEKEELINDESSKLSRIVIKSEGPYDQSMLAKLASKNWSSQKSGAQKLDADFLAKWLAGKLDIPFFQIDSLKMDSAALAHILHQRTAQRYQVLPIKIDGNDITFATTDPYNLGWTADLRRTPNVIPKVVIANPEKIAAKIEEIYNLANFVGSAPGDSRQDASGVQNLEQLLTIEGGNADNEKNIVKIVDWLLQYAIKERASDIHIEPKREKGLVRLRIDGVLNTVYSFPVNVTQSLTSRLKILGRMNIAEKRKPQDGRIKTLLPGGTEVELRLSTMPTTFGEKMVLRIFDPTMLQSSFADLGLDQREAGIWKKLIYSHHGIILVTGPTGSGKTTTLYTSLRTVSTSQNNVCTIEDPIEMVDPSFNQMQVQASIDLSFSKGVRTLLRQDPDIIMVGEIRDYETAEIACQASLTGHLVFSTLHTNDSASAIIRLLELGVPYYMIKATVIGIVAQRLLRMLCPHCKKFSERELTEAEWASLTKPFRIKPPAQTFQPVGCEKCRFTGYLGRKGIYEILEMNSEMLRLITPTADLEAISNLALKQGVHHLRMCGAKMLAKGQTSLDEILSTCPVR